MSSARHRGSATIIARGPSAFTICEPVVGDDVSRKRRLKITERTQAVVEDQFRRFREKFGRDPGPDDPVFFDPDCDQPTPLTLERLMPAAVAAMERAGTPAEVIYAYVKTDGLLIPEEDRHLWSQEELALWDAAIEGYFSGEDLQ